MPPLNAFSSPPHPFWSFVASMNDNASLGQAPARAENQASSVERQAAPESRRSYQRPTVEDESTAERSSQPSNETPAHTSQTPVEETQMPFRGRCGNADSSPRQRPPWDRSTGGCARRHARREGCGLPYARCRPYFPQDQSRTNTGDFFSHLAGAASGFMPRGGSHPSCRRNRGQQNPNSDPSGCGRWQSNNNEPNIDIGDFLGNMSSMLRHAVEGSELDTYQIQSLFDMLFKPKPSPAEGVDFDPPADLFDTPSAYLVHVSLPGAKKSDLGVDWIGENSTLRVSGVVHRPNIDENTLQTLAVNGRNQEVGFFEKMIRLGNRKESASVDVAGIKAKLTDGILVVKVPKVEQHHARCTVPIDDSSSSSSSSSISPPSPTMSKVKQAAKTPAVDYDASAALEQAPDAMELDDRREGSSVADARSPTEAGDDRKNQDLTYEDPPEQLPEYVETPHPDVSNLDGDDDEENESEGEPDYVKIDVN